jgi:dihydroneopterin aldolase
MSTTTTLPIRRASRLTTTFAIRQEAGEPVAVVRVKNLSGVICGPQDAWGRVGKPQPVLVSAEVSFREPFAAGVDDGDVDELGSDTVNYGSLSKVIQASLEGFRSENVASGSTGGRITSLRGVLDAIFLALTGYGLKEGSKKPTSEDFRDSSKGFLDLSKTRLLSVTVCLPKASLLGEGVCLRATSTFPQTRFPEDKRAIYPNHAITLRLDRLRVPTLIGLNANERDAKQVVIATVEVDQFVEASDVYPALERCVTTVS